VNVSDEQILPPDRPDAPPPPWGSETREERLERLLTKARSLPKSPGVYFMKDASGVTLYIGKAVRLAERVSSYFVPSADLGPKKTPMLDVVHDIEILECASEVEALLAEARLIKDTKPHYNSRQSDDKTFPYLVVTLRDDFPGVYVTRQPAQYRGAKVYGPFTSSGALREALQLMQRIFKFRSCTLEIIEGDPKNRFFRPCLLHAIGQCTAPCAERVSAPAYREDIDRLLRFMGSKRRDVLRELRREMESASGEMEYEKAAVIRDQIDAILKLDERASTKDRWQPEAEIAYLDPEKGPRSLQRTLGIDTPVRCVEGIDIAHLQGNETVGSLVSFVDGRPFKEGYRRFRIKTVTNDDYAAIREVVSRRYRDAGAGQELYPDVVLIDGGLGQLHAALEAFAGLDIKPPMVISLAKKEELLYTQERTEPIRLGRDNAGLRLCQSVRDEAHRFAQHYHHILRRKKTTGR